MLPLLVAVAAWLRFGGLSHDLDVGYVYHPETPGQVAATQVYLTGAYDAPKADLIRDGGAYFNSRLMEWVFRAIRQATGAVTRTLGIETVTPHPTRTFLFWQTRAWNAFLSSMTVLLVYHIARALMDARLVGLVAATLMAVSPIDMVACHHATGNTTCAFFAGVTVLLAIRMHRDGRPRVYVAAGIALVAAFASGYHGGFAAAPLLMAHILRHPPPRALFGRPSLDRLGLATLAALLALPVAIPALWVAPNEAIGAMLGFLTSGGPACPQPGTPSAAPCTGWLLGMARLVPPFAYMVSTPLLLAAVGATALARRRPAVATVAALPFVYAILTGIRGVPDVERYTLVTPCLFSLAAAGLVELSRMRRFRAITIPLAVLVGASAVGLLSARSLDHRFFFEHRDTRRLAREWVEDNLPATFAVNTDRHTWPGTPPANITNVTGTVSLSSAFHPRPAPETWGARYVFDLGDDALALHRNPRLTLHIHDTDWLRPGWRHPTFQFLPYPPERGILFLGAPAFNRSPRRRTMQEGHRAVALAHTPSAVTEVLLVFEAGARPTRVRSSFGERACDLTISAGEADFAVLTAPKPVRAHAGGMLYAWFLRASIGDVATTFASTDEEKGIALAQAGLFAPALPYLKRAAADPAASPAAELMYRIAARAVDRGAADPDRSMAILSDADPLTSCGTAPELFRHAPAATLGTADDPGWRQVDDTWRSPELFLSPGVYSVDVSGTVAGAAVAIVETRSGVALPLTADTPLRFLAPFGPRSVQIAVQTGAAPPSLTVTLHPDARATLREFSALARRGDSAAETRIRAIAR